MYRAKLFMPAGARSADSAGDADALVLLSMLQYCTHFHGLVSKPKLAADVRENVRNPVLHAAPHALEEDDFKAKMGAIEALLTQGDALAADTGCIEALDRVRTLRDSAEDAATLDDVREHMRVSERSTRELLRLAEAGDAMSQRTLRELRSMHDDLTSVKGDTSLVRELL